MHAVMTAILSQILTWPTLLTAIAFVFFVTSGRWRWGYLIGIGWEILWLIYGILSHSAAFALSGAAFSIVFARNYYIWPQVHSGARKG